MAIGTIGKTILATSLAGGIAITGITFSGDGDITNIKGNLDNMKDEITQAVDDNEFLKSQFDKLQGLYGDSVDEANTTINGLLETKAELETKIYSLQEQVASHDMTDEQETLQKEITRLEGEVKEANQKIAELSSYAQQVDDSTTYTAVDKEAYTATEQEVQDIPLAVQIDDYLTTSENRNALVNRSVELVSGDYIKVKVVPFGTDGAGNDAYKIKYFTEDNVTINPNATIDGVTLEDYMLQQVTDVEQEFGISINMITFETETLEVKAVVDGSGMDTRTPLN